MRMRGCGKDVCIDLEGGAAREVLGAAEAAAGELPRVLGVPKGFLRLTVYPKEGLSRATLKVGLCMERLDYVVQELLEGRGPQTLLRSLIVDMDRLGLTLGQMGRLYELESTVVDSPFYSYIKWFCHVFGLKWSDVARGRADLPRPSAARRRARRDEVEERMVQNMLERFKSFYRSLFRREAYWENGFTLEAVDPFPMLRSLCLDDIMETLQRIGAKVVSTLDSEGFCRESHHIILLEDGTMIEINCSAFMDEFNWVKIHTGEPGKTWLLIKEILRDHYSRMAEEHEKPTLKKAYKALLRALDEAEGLEDVARAVAGVKASL